MVPFVIYFVSAQSARGTEEPEEEEEPRWAEAGLFSQFGHSGEAAYETFFALHVFAAELAAPRFRY